jgi:predicted NAD/FAD-dependent oxidoreductase
MRTLQSQWDVNGMQFDAVVLACPSKSAAQLAAQAGSSDWAATAQRLQVESIATVYAHAPDLRLPSPMLVLPNSADQPAQFVFDRGQLGGPTGLMACVVSANTDGRDQVESKVLQQAARQLPGSPALVAVQTVLEKRATFACTPGLIRPEARIARGLWACGDYVAGPYPATLEGAVRSGLEVGQKPDLCE